MAQTTDRSAPAQGARSPVLELSGVVLTGVVHVVFEEVLHQKALFITVAAGAWLTYIVVSVRRDPRVLAEWGFRRPGFRPTLAATTIVAVLGAASLAGFAAVRGTLDFHWHILPLFALYPLWGWVQHFLLQAMVARHLHSWIRSARVVTPITAILFAAVHWPDPVLMAATAVLALCFTPIYLRWRNLWPLGVYHGWLGALAYFWVLGRDPWEELRLAAPL